MLLGTVDTVDKISSRDFRIKYLAAQKPLVIKELSKEWPALTKWNWSYFRQLIGNKKVGLYNNIKSDAYTPVNMADDYKTFGEYIDMISRGPAAWRIFSSIFLTMRLLLCRTLHGPNIY